MNVKLPQNVKKEGELIAFTGVAHITYPLKEVLCMYGICIKGV